MKPRQNFIFVFFVPLFISLSVGCSSSPGQEAKLTPSISSIENLSQYIFKLRFDQIQGDKFLKNHFKIKKDVMEDDGVQWGAYALTTDSAVEISIENNWEDSITISRITFLSDKYHTTEGVSVGSAFAKIRNYIDTVNLNDGPEGLEVLHEKKNAGISFLLDTSGYPDMYDGISSIHEIPDTMTVSTIVVAVPQNGRKKN